MRVYLLTTLCAVLTFPCRGQVPEDTAPVKWGTVHEEPSSFASDVAKLSWGDTVKVIGSKETLGETYLQVVYNGGEGWLLPKNLMDDRDKRIYKRESNTPGKPRAVEGGKIRGKPVPVGDRIANLVRGDTVRVFGKRGSYARVSYNEEKGWLAEDYLLTEQEMKEYERKLDAQLKESRRKEKYLQSLRQKGYTIMMTRQTFRKNSADGISMVLGMVNISQSKTVKYARITWKLYNSVGDPTLGENSGRATAQTRLVGPLKPGESGYTEFKNVWYSPVGTCAEIRGIHVEHIDGSSFTYIDDLKDIAKKAESVRLMGDCTYEAQQNRKN